MTKKNRKKKTVLKTYIALVKSMQVEGADKEKALNFVKSTFPETRKNMRISPKVKKALKVIMPIGLINFLDSGIQKESIKNFTTTYQCNNSIKNTKIISNVYSARGAR